MIKSVEIEIKFNGSPLTVLVKDHGIPLNTDKSHAEIFSSMRDSFNMTKQRCYNKNSKDYRYYGGRGISICDRWLESPINLLIDMGLRPDGYTLERIDNDGPYSPENCKWATRAVQATNSRNSILITRNGETHTIAEWERRLGFKPGTLKARLGMLNYTIDEAFTKPVKYGGLVQGKVYQHMQDQSWRTTTAMRAKPKQPALSVDNVKRARALYTEVAMTFSSIAKLFGVCIETASQAVQKEGPYGGKEYA